MPKIEFDSIVVKNVSWGRHCRASFTMNSFNRISVSSVIKNRDTINMILRELSGLKFLKEICLCNKDLSAKFVFHYVEYAHNSIDNEIDTLQYEQQCYFTSDGNPVDMIWQEFKRSDKLIELLQLPPYPSDK